MSGNKNWLVKQESRESYGDEAVEGATAISQGNGEFDKADDKFEEARAEDNSFNAERKGEITARTCSHRADNLAGHAKGKKNEL